MAHISLGEAFSASVEWTKTIFFRPFSFKKWIVLYVIAMLAFGFQGGLNLRINNTSHGTAKKADLAQSLSQASAGAPIETARAASSSLSVKEVWNKYRPFFIGFGVLLVMMLLLILWLRSVFIFVFLEAIANNEASIKMPFARNVRIGNSYFGWTLLLTVLMLLGIAVPFKLGYDTLAGFGLFSGNRTAPFGTIVLSVLPHMLITLALLVIGGLVTFFFEDYVSLVMYKKRISLPEAISPAAGLIFSSFLTTIKYIFLKVGLAIGISIISTIASLFMLVTFLSPIAIVGFALGFLYKVIPTPVRAVFFIMLALFGLPIIATILFVTNVLFTPLSVFYRTFNMKFIARLDEKYDLFKPA